ncbi:hypothetical protein HGRIS_013913 [Hohenbuehelia grisea]|uniref:DUF6593 domain-containing protein n=1 Tax=Hohenbuehelia grisea TaxID=104357 RepID=A0ABR3IWY4_9AGAR
MYGNNPYGQAGWPNAANRGMGGPPPSIFGALPYYTPPTRANTLIFQFTSFNPDVMNCTVLGPKAQPYYRIVTDAPTPGFTVFQNGTGKNFAFIEWRSHPQVEIRGAVHKQRAGDLLPLSASRSLRRMQIGERQYEWIPNEQYISLCTAGSGAREVLARISRSQTCVNLEMTSQAISLGLLDIAVVVTVLLQSGRSID